MTVQELINKLNAVQDKSKKVSFSDEFGTNEMRDPFGVIAVREATDCVIVI